MFRRIVAFVLLLGLMLSLLPEVVTLPAEAADLATYLYQLPPQVINEKGISYGNMSYIIKTRNGKIIVLDGGYSDSFMDDTVHSDSSYLLSMLRSVTGKSVPNVDAWFFTHMHADHVGAFKDLMVKHREEITISAIYYRFPTDAEIEAYCPESNWTAHKNMVASFGNHVALAKNAEGGKTKVITIASRFQNPCLGSFDIDTVHFDVLLTCEDVFWGAENIGTKYSGNRENNGKAYSSRTIKELVYEDYGNNTSAVFRMTTGGKTVLFLGDAAEPAGIMLKYYHDKHTADSNSYFSLKSDMVQMAHHGQNGVAKNVYYAIDPDVALWPTADWLYEVGSGSEYTTYYTRQWMKALGTTNYVAKDGLQTVSFPDLRTEEIPTVPEDLKPFVFDSVYYLKMYPALEGVFGQDEEKLYAHFLKYGIEEGRCASPFFDVKYYMHQNSLKMQEYCRGNYEKAFLHFLSYAYSETEYASAGKKLSPVFDCKYYKEQYPILADAGIKTEAELLQYYVSAGKALGHIPSPDYIMTEPGGIYHPAELTDGISPTCTAEGKTQGKHCALCGEILVPQESLPPTEHSFVGGICSCGATDGVTLLLDPNIKLSHSLDLASDISVNFLVAKSLLADYEPDTVYVECTVNSEGQTVTRRLLPEERGESEYYYFTLKGLTAVEMTDRLDAVLYGRKNGQPYASSADSYSIADYAYSRLNRSNSPASLKSLCADLLRYGAKAQSYKGYRTESLADSAMTESHRAYLTDLETVSFPDHYMELGNLSKESFRWTGKGLALDTRVALTFRTEKLDPELRDEDWVLLIEYRDRDGQRVSYETEALDAEKSGELYTFRFSQLTAAELRTVLHLTVCHKDGRALSKELIYSADTYGYNKTGTLAEVCKALFAYSDSAKAYFAAS